MTTVLILIAGLQGIHGTHLQCTTISSALFRFAVKDPVTETVQSDFEAIKKFRTSCEKN
jgi:hypothetical protein